MGRPVTAPFIRILATEENQTGNTYRTVYFNLTNDDCPLYHWPGHDAGKWATFLPNGGEIRTSTASAASKDGGLETFCVADETHVYSTPELREMRDVVIGNLWKRKRGAGTWLLETTTMFAPGENSAAEQTFAEAEALETGRKKHGSHRLYYDHRWGDCPDLANEEMLRQAIREAYGDALAWMDEDSLVETAYDSRTSEARVRRYILNSQTASSDAWLKPHEWDACKAPEKALHDGDTVTLGADGSVNDDATAVVACRLDDAHLELLGYWQKPEDWPDDVEWQVDREAVDACISDARRRFNVVGMFMDPPHWADYLDRWHNEFAHKMKVQATQRRPLEWWTNRPTQMVLALQRFWEAVRERRVSFTPADDRVGEKRAFAILLRRDVLNARRNPTRAGLQIRKDYPKSPKKIDACMAAVLAYECRNDGIAGGAGKDTGGFFMPKRIR